MTFLHMYRVSLPISVDLPLILVCRLPVAATTAALYDHGMQSSMSSQVLQLTLFAALGFGQEVSLLPLVSNFIAHLLHISPIRWISYGCAKTFCSQ